MQARVLSIIQIPVKRDGSFSTLGVQNRASFPLVRRVSEYHSPNEVDAAFLLRVRLIHSRSRMILAGRQRRFSRTIRLTHIAEIYLCWSFSKRFSRADTESRWYVPTANVRRLRGVTPHGRAAICFRSAALLAILNLLCVTLCSTR
jgi:hypothetical protein